MQGSKAVVDALNGLLVDEFAAYQQYLAHYQAAENLGYAGLAARIKDRAEDELRHAGILTGRIVAIGGTPAVNSIGKVDADIDNVSRAVDLDAAAELRAVEKYNAAIAVCVSESDNATRAIIEPILVEEDNEHLNELEGWQIELGTTGVGLAAFVILRGKG